ncbi:MAG: DUF1697 domain-containing protein [Planctomycetota bacterium]
MTSLKKDAKIALLRGINVGGHNRLAMSDLRDLCEQIGFGKVRTYIQSGNILLNSDVSDSKLAEQLREELDRQLKLDVPVVVVAARELQKAVQQNPWPDRESEALHMAVLSAKPKSKLIQALRDSPKLNLQGEAWECVGRFIFLDCPKGVAKSKLTNPLFEKHLEVTSTARNWKTIHKLLELSLA